MLHIKQTEHVGITSDRHVQDLLETLHDALFFADDQQKILYVNATAATRVGATKQELLGNSLWSCAPYLVSLDLYRALARVHKRQEPLQVKYHSPFNSTWLHVHLLPATDGIVLSVHEEAESPLSQDAAYSGEQMARDILENLPTSVVVLTSEGIVLTINQTPLESAQIQRAEVLGKKFAEAPWWSDSLACQQDLRAAIVRASRGEIVQFETRIRSRGGRYLDRAATITPYLDDDGCVEYLIYTSSDITVRKQAEDELRALVDAMPQLVWIGRTDGSVEYYNQRWRDYTRLSLEQAQEDEWIACLHPEDQQKTREAWHTAVQTGCLYETEERLRNGVTGEYRWFLTRGAPYRDTQGTIVKWIGTLTDIEDRKRIEDALRQSQKRAQALMESTIMGIVVVDGETLVEANDAFLQMTGYSREEVQSSILITSTLVPPEWAARDWQALEELAASQQVKPYETACVCKDGSILPILLGIVALPGHPSQTIGFVLDNSVRKELERRKDDFISIASHELKTPLTSLKLQTQLLEKKLVKQGSSGSAPALARMDGQVKQLERLVGELLDVSKIQAGQLEYLQETVNLDELLHEVAEAMQQMSTTHSIVVRGAAHTPLIGDRDRLGQVFINLISNAIKYSPDASKVEIVISADAERITVSVSDQGIGISQEQREKVFERFYRAVVPGQKAFPGLGMGLYIVAEIVKQHMGTITVESKIGEGSTFYVTLPLKRDAER